MKKIIGNILAAALAWAAIAIPAAAQTTPNLTYKQVPTAAQWNSYFAAKQDYLGSPPLLTVGGTLLGKLTTAASGVSGAGFNLQPGAAPSSPVDGDLWATAGSLFVQINGVTHDLLASPTFTTLAYTTTLTGTTTNASCVAVGRLGATNPAFQVDCSVASQATGVKITGKASGAGAAIAAISSAGNENLNVDAKGSGTISVGFNSTGIINLVRSTQLGAVGSVVGNLVFANLTSGGITLQPTTGALGSSVITLPAITDTMAGKALANGGTNNSLTASNGGVVYSDASKLNILAGTVTAGQCLLSGSNAAPSWGSCAGGAAVSSVANSDGTLTVSPTTGAVVASLNLGHANAWTALQDFTASGFSLKGSSTGKTTFTSQNAGASNFTATLQSGSQTLAALDLAGQTIAGGANVTSLSQSTGNITVDCGARPLQFITNNGAWTITAPSSDGSCMLLVTNGASAAIPSFSGFTVGSSTGDSLTTTNTSKFVISVVRINGTSTYVVKALQ